MFLGNNSALVQVMAWRRTGDKPLSEPKMTKAFDTKCTRPQRVNYDKPREDCENTPCLQSISRLLTTSGRQLTECQEACFGMEEIYNTALWMDVGQVVYQEQSTYPIWKQKTTTTTTTTTTSNETNRQTNKQTNKKPTDMHFILHLAGRQLR